MIIKNKLYKLLGKDKDHKAKVEKGIANKEVKDVAKQVRAVTNLFKDTDTILRSI